mgnify:FL=1
MGGSRRGYGALSRWSDRYGRTARYYEDLFTGELGFEPAACFGRLPRLGGFVLADDPTAGLSFPLPDICKPGGDRRPQLGRLDESFVVYDHPQVIIFKASPDR